MPAGAGTRQWTGNMGPPSTWRTPPSGSRRLLIRRPVHDTAHRLGWLV
ncbi:hypothetical protein ACIOKD_11280 [Streptomyces sp. NPDC087844]